MASASSARGTGASEAYAVEDEVDLRMGTFSKSLASCGGFIAGPGEVIDFLRGPVALVHVHCLRRAGGGRRRSGALRIIRSPEGPELFARVLANARYLHDRLAELGYEVVEPTVMPDGSELVTPIVPVVIGDDWRAVLFWKALYDSGVYVNVALYPAVQRGEALHGPA